MKLSVPSVSRPDPKSWVLAAFVALVLGVLVLLDNGSLSSSGATPTCRIQVTAEILNVRDAPSQDGATTSVLRRGDQRGAETTVRDGYRELADGGWALDDFVRPLPGSKCAADA